MLIPHPPPIHNQIVYRQRMRFTCTTARAAATVYFKDLLDTLNVAATAVTAFALFDQVKINAIEVWAAPVQGAAPGSVAVQFTGATAGSIGDGRIWSDVSMGVEPAHVLAKPARLSQAALWQYAVAQTSAAFQLTCPVASVIDVDLSFRTVATFVPTATTNAPVGAVAGEIYYRGLDGVAAAGTTLPAVATLVD